MNTLRSNRAELKSICEEAGFFTFDYVPETVKPPVIVVEYGVPYVELGGTFGTHVVRFHLNVIVGQAKNEVETDALDAAIIALIPGLRQYHWLIEEVDKPQEFTIGAADYLGTYINLRSPEMILKEEED